MAGINIIYLTTACGLACTYCYEDLPNVKPKTMTREELEKIADETLERENPNEQTLFVLFGGEPTLEWDNAKYFMDYVYSKKKFVQFNMTSNGIKFLDDDFFNDYITNKHYIEGRLSLDISYDGKEANYKRIYKDGRDSTEDVVKVLKKFSKNNVKYRIRTTVSPDNINNLVEEIVSFSIFNPQRVILSVNWNGFENYEQALKQMKVLKNRITYLWNSNKLSFPVCELVCETCDGCSQPKSQIYDYAPKSNVKIRQKNDNKEFTTFERKDDGKKIE
jgi:sulfatase maturation enzyme AslB (radical SAM superfamily)